MANKRWLITPGRVDATLKRVGAKVADNLAVRGKGALISPDEIYGFLARQFHELEHAARVPADHPDLVPHLDYEVLDIAAAAVIALASITPA